MKNKNALLSLFIAVAVVFSSLPLFSQTVAARPTEPQQTTMQSNGGARPAVATAAALPHADATATTTETNGNTYGMSWREAWGYGGFIMWILLMISILMIALVIYFLCLFRESAVAPRRLVAEIRENFRRGDLQTVRHVCELHPCPVSSLALAAVDFHDSAEGEDDRQLLRDVVESEGTRLADSMQSQTQLLLDLSAIAPMLGLLGTTLGMLKAFGAVAHDIMAAAKPVLLAQGVSEAIVTTIFGLIVAIPCMAFYAFFRRRTSHLTGLLEAAATDILASFPYRRGLQADR